MFKEQKSPPPERSEFDSRLLVGVNMAIRQEGLPNNLEEMKAAVAKYTEKVQDEIDAEPGENPGSRIDEILRYEAEIADNPIHSDIYKGVAEAIEWDDYGKPEIAYQNELGKILFIANEKPKKIDKRNNPPYKRPGYIREDEAQEQYDTAAVQCFEIMRNMLRDDPVGALRVRDEIGLQLMGSDQEALDAHFESTYERVEKELSDKQVVNLQRAIDMFDRHYAYSETMRELVMLIVDPVREAAKSATRDRIQFEQKVKNAAQDLKPLFDIVRDDPGWDKAVEAAKAELSDCAERAIAQAEAENSDIIPIDPRDIWDFTAYRVFELATASKEEANAA